MTHLALWIFIGLMLVGSHVWNAGCLILNRKPLPD